MLGFRYPFCNGSFEVSDKGLRNPNRPFNVLIRRTNKFGINMPITSTAQHIRRVKVASFVGRGGIALLDTTTLHIVLLLLRSTLSLLHKSLLERKRLFGLVILLLVLGLGCKPNSFLGHNFLLIAQKVVEVLLSLYARHKAFLKLLLQLGILLHKMHMLTTWVSIICIIN